MEKIRIQILTSILMPCYVINPKWNLLAYLSLLSSLILSLMLAFLVYLSHYHQHLLDLDMIDDFVLYQKMCYCLMGGLIFGSFVTTFLQLWWIRRNHQSFIFQYFYGNEKIVETMLKSKDKTIDFNEVNHGQRTALHFACLFGDEKIVKLILLYGKNVGFNFNAKTMSDFKEYPNDCTAYIYACYNKDEALVNLFKSHAEGCGIDLNARDKNGHDGAYYRRWQVSSAKKRG